MRHNRIAARFAALKAEDRAGLITYVMAGDPDVETAFEILKGLPAAGADLIELGFPFSDPMAEGPPIQRAALRALKIGMTLRGTLDLVRRFRIEDKDTPIILMGYTNPVLSYGFGPFAQDAAAAGVAHTLSLLLADAGWGVFWRSGGHTRSEPVRAMHHLAENEKLLGWLYVGGIPENAKASTTQRINPEDFLTTL